VNPSPLRWLRVVFLGVSGLLLLGVFALACVFVYLAPGLPTARNAQAVPLRVYSRTGDLISQIGEERRYPVTYEQIPEVVRNAVLAAEDDRFFSHHGFDWMGITRAVISNVASADATGQGGSTITQQAARNMFLTLDQTSRRKASEVFVTFRMERDLSKEEILATYLNVAFFGHRSYGIAAAAQTYYGKRLDQLTVGQTATLIGLLPSPSKYNPISSPSLAKVRRGYVLGRMVQLDYIDKATAEAAGKEPIETREYAPLVDVEADYIADWALQEVVKRFGPAAVNQGYKVFTTIDGRLQTAANYAARGNLMQYDRRHGYRGRLGKVQLPAGATTGQLDQLLGKYDSVGLLQPAVVTKVGEKNAEVHIRGGGKARIDWDGLKWAGKALKNGEIGALPGKASDVVAVGDVIHVVTDKLGAALLAQVPDAQTAFVAMDPLDGAIVSLVGGFDFHRSNFNRVRQALRQPASGFKPFIYSAALENGYTAATGVLNLPVVEDCDDEDCWNPQNSGGGYGGVIRLRDALKRSINLISRRVVHDIGVDAVIDHAVKFGFRRESLPRIQSLALGAQLATPLEMVTAYSVFANGGFRVEPYFITRIEDAAGKVVFEAKPKIACAACESAPVAEADADASEVAMVDTAQDTEVSPTPGKIMADLTLLAAPGPLPRIRDVEAPPALRELVRNQQGGTGILPADRLAPRAISAQNAWLMSDMMHDATVSGTAARAARELKRNDLAGKTGTNEERDNWFNGFTRDIVATVWVGFDDERPLGSREQGSFTALPAWIEFMRVALDQVPQSRLERPGGLIDLRVSASTGLLADQSDPTAVYETFMVDHLPNSPEGGAAMPGPGGTRGSVEPLF
jgi:penicillin-binding protein 1A